MVLVKLCRMGQNSLTLVLLLSATCATALELRQRAPSDMELCQQAAMGQQMLSNACEELFAHSLEGTAVCKPQSSLIQEEACGSASATLRLKLDAEVTKLCEEMCKLVKADGCAPCRGKDAAGSADDEDSGVAPTSWEELLQHMQEVQSWSQDLMFELNNKHGRD
mmetsp:Transcript_60160/g.143400  ORF Transcript_60160/g.143400 Transcript_60160/m.143400 type:complete len:165 (+) Transcript_60160:53-547(+)